MTIRIFLVVKDRKDSNKDKYKEPKLYIDDIGENDILCYYSIGYRKENLYAPIISIKIMKHGLYYLYMISS